MPPADFEPPFPVSERPQTDALNRAATGTGGLHWYFELFIVVCALCMILGLKERVISATYSTYCYSRKADYPSFCLHHNSSVLLPSVHIPYSAVQLQHLASLLFHRARTQPPSISHPRLKEEGSTNPAVFPNALYSADISQSLLIMVFCH